MPWPYRRYARGLMVVADSHAAEPTTSLLVSDRDLMHLAHDPPQRGLREVVASQSVAGHVLAVAELRDDNQNGGGDKATTGVAARGELATQHSHGARSLVVVSSEGVLTLSKARPVDCLAQLLEAGLREPLTSFFKSYGQVCESHTTFLPRISTGRERGIGTHGGEFQGTKRWLRNVLFVGHMGGNRASAGGGGGHVPHAGHLAAAVRGDGGGSVRGRGPGGRAVGGRRTGEAAAGARRYAG